MRSLCLLHISQPPLVFGLFTLGLGFRSQITATSILLYNYLSYDVLLGTTHHHIPAYINSRDKCLIMLPFYSNNYMDV